MARFVSEVTSFLNSENCLVLTSLPEALTDEQVLELWLALRKVLMSPWTLLHPGLQRGA